MTAPTPYLYFAGTARDALTFYGDVFGCRVQLHTFGEFQRDDGPSEAIAHGFLLDGPVALFAADAGAAEPALPTEPRGGIVLALLGTAPPATLRGWFTRLSTDGRVVEELQTRPWGASDGQVVDRFGVHWLVGFDHAEGG